MFEVGDIIETTDMCAYPEFPMGTKGKIVNILPEVCPFRYIVVFDGDRDQTPMAEAEITK